MNCSSCAYYLYEGGPICGRGLPLTKCNNYLVNDGISERFETYTMSNKLTPNLSRENFPDFLRSIPGLIPIRMSNLYSPTPNHISRLYVYMIEGGYNRDVVFNQLYNYTVEGGYNKDDVYHTICSHIPNTYMIEHSEVEYVDVEYPDNVVMTYINLFLDLSVIDEGK